MGSDLQQYYDVKYKMQMGSGIWTRGEKRVHKIARTPFYLNHYGWGPVVR